MTICEQRADKKIRFRFDELELTDEVIVKLIGSGEKSDRDYLLSLVQNILSETRIIADIRAEYRIFTNISIDEQDKSVYVGEVRFNIGNIIFPQLKKADYLVLFLCTAGCEVGRRSADALKNNDPLTGYIYDIVGNEIVERAADLMQEELKHHISGSGFNITNRYSPGYCGWNVAEQHKLFSFFPCNFCRVSLTPSALMNPVKSISGIIGLGENVKKNPYTCKICTVKDCIYRNQRES